jgi:L-Lysine epsilon oxidase N-terminal/L-lysine epsilon oxidase C-terminal domain
MPTARKPHGTSTSNVLRARRTATRTAVVAPLSSLNARLGARTEFRVYPSIGIARVGDCKDSFMIGPEAPGVVPSGPFRGADKGLKPQAARFRIYKVEIDANENETVVEEIIAGKDTKIEWSASLANRKAGGLFISDTLARVPNPRPRNKGLDRKKLVIAANGSVTGSGTRGPVLSGAIEFAKPRARGKIVRDIVLATLQTDEAGRLLVVGGPGKSGSPRDAPIGSFSDNDGWFDSVSDGPVSATLHIRGQAQPVVPAWVVVTVPRYAPGIYGIVTWYDQAVSMARTNTEGRFDPPRTTSFTRDIYPILKRADALSGVHGIAHANGQLRPLSDAARLAEFATPSKRAAVLSKLAPIGTDAKGFENLPPGLMPRLFSGANPDPGDPVFTFVALTRYQMGHIENWVHGNFDADWPGSEPVPTAFEKIPVARQAWALCEAALETCVGGPFFPGIEGTYDIARVATYHPQSHLRREFRINPAHPAGFLTEKMALPWQADFADCGNFWWPSQRPDDVTRDGEKKRWDEGIVGPTKDGHLNMVNFWSRLGFVVSDAATDRFVEVDRTL